MTAVPPQPTDEQIALEGYWRGRWENAMDFLDDFGALNIKYWLRAQAAEAEVERLTGIVQAVETLCDRASNVQFGTRQIVLVSQVRAALTGGTDV